MRTTFKNRMLREHGGSKPEAQGYPGSIHPKHAEYLKTLKRLEPAPLVVVKPRDEGLPIGMRNTLRDVPR